MATNSATSTIGFCGHCSKIFTDPRLLPCLHSFCSKCLIELFENEKSDVNLQCPKCHQGFSVTDNNVKNLPKDLRGIYEADVAKYEANMKDSSAISCDRCIDSSESFATTFCCKCCKFLCLQCTQDHKRWRETYDHELVNLGKGKDEDNKRKLLNSIPHKKFNCQIHADEVLKFYCETCSELICRDCRDIHHKDHEWDRVEKVSEKEKIDLMSGISEAESAVDKLESAMKKGEKVIQIIKAKQRSADKEIKKHYKDLSDALEQCKEALLSKGSGIANEKIASLEQQGQNMKDLQDQITSICNQINKAAEDYTPEELLSAKKVFKDKLQTLIKQFNMCSLEPCKEDMIITSFNTATLKNSIAKFGVITGGCYAGASTAAIYIPQAIKGKEKKIAVTARDIQGKIFPHGKEVVSAQMGRVGANELTVQGIVKDNKNGTYEVYITPQTNGEHQLKITVGNEDIKSSPFIIHVMEERNYSSLSKCLYTYKMSSKPWDVVFGDNEEMFIVDYSRHCIQIRNKVDNNVLKTIGKGNGSSGSDDGEFSHPSAIAIKDGVIYVTENKNHRVQKFTTSGKYISKFGTKGSGDSQLSAPRGICIDPEGKVYVSEYSNNRVSVFSADGVFDHHISGNLSNPWGLAFDPQGNLHVANHGSNSISVYDSSGMYVTQYGSGTLQCPAGIAIDPEGYIFVSEYHNRDSSYNYSRLFMFDPQFKSIHYIQAFQYSIGIALDNDGYIYICDSQNSRVCKY